MWDIFFNHFNTCMFILFSMVLILIAVNLKYSKKKTLLIIIPVNILICTLNVLLSEKLSFYNDWRMFLFFVFLPQCILTLFISKKINFGLGTALINSYIGIYIIYLTYTVIHNFYPHNLTQFVIFLVGAPLLMVYMRFGYKNLQNNIENILPSLTTLLAIYSLVLFVEIQIYAFLIGYASNSHVLRLEIFGVAILSVYILSIIFFHLIIKLINNKMLELNNYKWVEANIAYTLEHFKQIERKNDKLRIINHDLRHILSITSTLIQSGENDKALEFINKYTEILEKNRTVRFCEDTLINSTIEYYYVLCQKNNIKFNCKINNIEDALNIPSHEVVVLISNCLENALKASLKLTDNKVINFTFLNNNGRLILQIENNYNGIIKLDSKNRPVNDEINHGIGTASIEYFTKKNNLILDYNITSDKFKIIVLFK